MQKIEGINLTPTWPEAARIIAAALENGTGTGRDMARTELYRMAAILDSLQQTQSGPALFEVITQDEHGIAFGQTFGHQENAEAYANAMKSAGYKAEVSPEFSTPNSFEQAMEYAAEFYQDRTLIEAAAKKEQDSE